MKNNDFPTEQPLVMTQYSMEHFHMDNPQHSHLTGDELQKAYDAWLAYLYAESVADGYD